MRVYIDFDDVLCETARHMSDLARELFGRQVPYEAISSFNLQHAFSLSDAEIAALMEHAHRDDFLADLTPAPGSLEGVRALESRGCELVVVTGRPAASHRGSRNWLRKYGLSHLGLLHVDKYGRADRHRAADTVPQTLDLDAFAAQHFDVAIEDSPTALDLLVPRRDCLVIIYDRPWNSRYAPTANMRRSASWAEIVELIGSGHRLTDKEGHKV